jgi:hypothetical protein
MTTVPQEHAMPRPPNYGQNRSEVMRNKQAKQNEKLRQQEEAVARRRAERAGVQTPRPEPEQEDDKS